MQYYSNPYLDSSLKNIQGEIMFIILCLLRLKDIPYSKFHIFPYATILYLDLDPKIRLTSDLVL